MANKTITDLTGTTWKLNETIPNPIVDASLNYKIQFISNNTTYNSLSFSIGGGLIYLVNLAPTAAYNFSDNTWFDEALRTIQITGKSNLGDDTKNPDLIAYLSENGELQSEETPETITDLTGTIWYYSGMGAGEKDSVTFELNFAIETSKKKIYQGLDSLELSKAYYNGSSIASANFYAYKNGVTKIYLSEEDIFKIAIAGGADATNPDLIDYLCRYFELLQDDFFITHDDSILDMTTEGQFTRLRTNGKKVMSDIVIFGGAEISYKGEVIGTISSGEYFALHFGGQKLTGDIVIKAIYDSKTEGLRYVLRGDGTYYSCEGIVVATDKDIVIPSTYNGLPVKEITSLAFYREDSITSVVIPNSVTKLDFDVFNGCESLTSVVIGVGVTMICGDAFSNCNKLTDVYYRGTQEEWNAITIDERNTPLFNATKHYNYQG